MASGYSFALISGTSMATPHIAGIAALIKQNNPSWTPSMIASAMSTTATKHDNRGEPIMAEGFAAYTLYRAAPFGYGAGLVDPTRALDPGLVFFSGNLPIFKTRHYTYYLLAMIIYPESNFTSLIYKQDMKITLVSCALFRIPTRSKSGSRPEEHVPPLSATPLT